MSVSVLGAASAVPSARPSSAPPPTSASPPFAPRARNAARVVSISSTSSWLTKVVRTTCPRGSPRTAAAAPTNNDRPTTKEDEMPGFIGVPELLMLGLVALLVFGPKRLPEMGRSLGKGMREFKDSVGGRNDELDPS